MLYCHIDVSHCNLFLIYSIYIPWPFPPVWGVADNTKEKQKQWGPHSVPLAMTRDPAEFEWHCWSNTAHPPHLPQLMSLHRCHLPYCPYHRVASIRQPRGNNRCQSNCVTIIRHSFLFLARSLASLISILLSLRALFTPSIHPNLGLPLALLPSTFAFITFFSSRSLSILST